MKKVMFLLFFTISLACEKKDEIIKQDICPNCIVAGDSINNIYTDIVPDTTISSNGIIGERVFEIDLDGNNIYDFAINVSYSTGASHEIADVSIHPYNKNKTGAFDSVPKINSNDSTIYVYQYYGVNYGDTIDNKLTFRNSSASLAGFSYVVTMGSSSTKWDNRNFIPVCLISNNDNCNYGWIKVSDVSSRKITIESFAVNIP